MNVIGIMVSGMLAMSAMFSEEGITGYASETVKVLPDTMRVTIMLEASDDDLEEAIADIQRQMKEFQDALRGMGKAPATGGVHGPYEGPPPAEEGSLQARMYRQMGMLGRGRESEQDEPKIRLTAVVKAEWKLQSKDTLSLLRESIGIRNAAETALPKPDEKAEEMTEEEEEEQFAAMMSMMGGIEEEKPGAPDFSYVGRIPDDLAAQARRKAFLVARLSAWATAAAAVLADRGRVRWGRTGGPIRRRMRRPTWSRTGSSIWRTSSAVRPAPRRLLAAVGGAAV